MPSQGANSPQVNLPQENDASVPASSFQNSFTPINNTKSQRQRLPNPDMNVPAQVLSSSPADPQENQKPGLAYASVTNIMKAALPARVRVSKEAVEFMRECAAEFIEFLTNEAVAELDLDFRKKLYEGDIFDVIESTRINRYAETLQPYTEDLKAQKRNGAALLIAKDQEMGAAAVQEEEAPQ